MLRGTFVKVNNKCKVKHLKGTTGIALERMKTSGYIRILSHYEGYLTDVCYREEELDIVEPPVEL